MFLMFAFIPWLAGFFGTAIAWFATYMARKWAIRLAVISSAIALTLAFTISVNSLILAIRFAAPPNWALALSLMPTNYTGCMGAYLTAHVMRWVYDYQLGFMARWIDQGL